MKMIKWMAMAALLCATGCESKTTSEVREDVAEVKNEAVKEAGEVKNEAANDVAEVKNEAAKEVAEINKDAKEEIAKITELKEPLADGVEPGFAYTEVVELKTDTNEGKKREIKLWVKEVTPAEGMAKLASQLKAAGFEEAADKGGFKHRFIKDDQSISLNTTDFATGDERGLGMVDVTVINK